MRINSPHELRILRRAAALAASGKARPQEGRERVGRCRPARRAFFERLIPGLEIDGEQFVMDPTNIGAIQDRILTKRVANLAGERYRILAAIDIVFVGV